MERVADYIVHSLIHAGCTVSFIVTGRGLLYLSDALAAAGKEIKTVCVHHEQAAGFAAYAYAEYTGTIGLCFVSTGCASTNAVTAVLNAYQDSVPVVFISGNNKLSEMTGYTHLPIRTFGNQESDIVDIVKSITKYSVLLTKPEDVAYEMEKALFIALNGRQGPVWIDVPLDVQNMRVEPETLKHFEQLVEFPPVSPDDLTFVIECLKEAKRPVIFIGSEVRRLQAVRELTIFLSKTQIPVVFDNSAVDIVTSEYGYAMGVVASIGGTRAGNFTVQNADFVLCVGTTLSPVTTGEQFDKFAREATVVAVTADENEFLKNTVRVDRVIITDCGVFLKALTDSPLSYVNNAWLEKCTEYRNVFPKCEQLFRRRDAVDMYDMADCLTNILPEKCVFLSDAGIEELVYPSTISFKKKQRCIHPASQGCMGMALPSAIGAWYAGCNDVVAVIGDGSVMMNIQELQTIAYNKIPLKLFIINNNCYSVIRHRQQELFRNRTIGTDKSNGVCCPDFKKVAECFGFRYVKIENAVKLEEDMRSVLLYPEAVICEVTGVEDQKYISNSFTRNAEKRFVQRPIEDQYPFLDRALFLKEMIVKPIDQ